MEITYGESNITDARQALSKVFHDTTLYGDGTKSRPLRVIGGGGSLPTQTGNAGKFLTTDGSVASWGTPAGSGTVTATGGSLTSNSIVLGAGTTDTKVVAGITTNGTSKITLGVAGSSVGSLDFKNATSGTITLSPVTGALGTVTLSLPASTDTLAGIAATQTLTNKTISGASNTLTVRLANDVTGNLPVTNLNSGTSASSSTFWRGDGTWAAPTLDSDLTTIAGLTPTNDDVMQYKAGAWANRTLAQLKTDLSLSGSNTGDQTISLTGDVTGSGTGSFAATIANSAVTLAKMANMATASILGRNTAGTGVPEVLSAATTKTLLSLNNVENTALSTWAGTTNITTLGTISTGAWAGTEIPINKGGTGLTTLGTASQQLRVNAGATALEYFTPSGGGGSGDILDGGNTTGAAVTIGTNDAFPLNFETTGVTRMEITGGASTGGQVTITNVTANTNTVSDGLTIKTNSTGTAAANFGGGILFQGESSTTDNQNMSRISSIWETATDASRRSGLVLSLVSGGSSTLTDCFSVKMVGSNNPELSLGVSNPVLMRGSSITPSASYTIGGSSSTVTIGASTGQVVLSSSNASGIVLNPYGSTNTGSKINLGNATNHAHTSGTKNLVDITAGFNPSSGTGVFTGLSVSGIINQTGTASGNVKGIVIEPTLTGILGTYYALEIVANSTSAKGVYQSGSSTVNNLVGSTSFGTTSAPNASALIDMVSTTKGFGVPAMTGTQRDAISSPRAGLIIYNTTTAKLNVYTTAWEAITSA